MRHLQSSRVINVHIIRHEEQAGHWPPAAGECLSNNHRYSEGALRAAGQFQVADVVTLAAAAFSRPSLLEARVSKACSCMAMTRVHGRWRREVRTTDHGTSRERSFPRDA